jgi:hypothetical protein
MKKFLICLLFIFIFVLVAYFFRVDILEYKNPNKINILNKVSIEVKSIFKSCSKPIKYSIGDFDTRFNVSREYLLSALTDAEEIWEKPFGKELFSYIPDSNDLKINLSFDSRQLITTKLIKVNEVVESNQTFYFSLKEKLVSSENYLEIEKSNYEFALDDFTKRQSEYNKQIEYWNTKGGAPENEYNNLEIIKSKLSIEADKLIASQKEIKEKVNEYNDLVSEINKLANTINVSADKYNTLSQSRGESFQEGVYKSSGLSKEIDIYEFESREKLVRLLAHELGHALGIEHVTDKKSIMYELNQGESMTLSRDDMYALKKVCSIE